MNRIPQREDEQQQALFDWAERIKPQYPELEMLVHIPNEGKRSLKYGAMLKRMGLKKGFPDCVLFVARGGAHGFAFELKRERGMKPSIDQAGWLERLSIQGYCTAVFGDWGDAAGAIMTYLRWEKTI